jgi:hypothetical protein
MTKLEAAGLRLASPYADRSMRLVTHYGITSQDIDRSLAAFAAVAAEQGFSSRSKLE